MKLGTLQILNIKCTIADIKKSDVARAIDVDQTMLSREIKSDKILHLINQYFDEINPEINEMVNRLTNKNSGNVLNEPTGIYKKSDLNKAFKLNLRLQEMLEICEKERDDYAHQLGEANCEIDELKKDLSKYKPK